MLRFLGIVLFTLLATLVIQVSIYSWINDTYFANVINFNYIAFIHIPVIFLLNFLSHRKALKILNVYLSYIVIIIVTCSMFMSSLPKYTYQEASELFQEEISASIKDIGVNKERLAKSTMYLDGFYAFYTVDDGFYLVDPRDGRIIKVR